MSLMGTRVRRVEDQRLLTNGGRYTSDLDVPGAVYAVFVRSTMAHAAIRSIDTSEAQQSSGVLGVFTLDDLGLPPAADPDISAMFSAPIIRPWLADGVVRFVGEPIAVVVATTQAAAVDASALVVVDYDRRSVVVDAESALAADAPLLFPEVGSNVISVVGAASDDADFFATCEVVVRHRIVNSRIAACPIEARGAISEWVDDRLHHWTPTQRPHGIRDTLAAYLGCEPSAIRLRTPDVGGGFGVKIGVAREELVVAVLARQLARPVRWHETRTEAMQAMGHGRGQVQFAELGGTRDGQILAYRLRVVQESGAYPDVGAILPVYTALMAPGVYRIASVAFSSQSVLTNTAPTVAFRGAGRPEATAALERIVDIYAAEVGLDPADVRRRNVIPADSFPYTTPTGACYDSGDYLGALDKALAAANYGELREEQQRRRVSGARHLLGIGLCLYVEITNAPGGADASTITITTEGDAVVTTGASPTGQGHETVWATFVADRLGLPLDRIRVVYGDTDVIASGRGTMGSSSLPSCEKKIFTVRLFC